MEEIFPSLFEISSNLEFVSCKVLDKNKKTFLGIVSTFNSEELFASDINLPKYVIIVNPISALFRVLSKNLKFKLILKFEF